MLNKWADPSRDRGDEIDAKTLYPDRFQYSQFQFLTPTTQDGFYTAKGVARVVS